MNDLTEEEWDNLTKRQQNMWYILVNHFDESDVHSFAQCFNNNWAHLELWLIQKGYTTAELDLEW